MFTTHVGKIGRLSKCTRDELGRRIEDGELGKEIVKWLNGSPLVQEVLKEQFGGRPITEQNLSEWRQRGHPEWLRDENTRSLVANLTEQAEALGEASEGQEISDLFAGLLAAELAALAKTLLEKETDPEKRWQRCCEVHRVFSQLRCDDSRAVRTSIKRERWNRETERQDEKDLEREELESKKRLRKMCFSVLQNRNMADLFGGGEQGKKMAEMLHRIEFDLPLDDLADTKLSGQTHPEAASPNPTESDQIQPNPTNLSNGHAAIATPHDRAT